VGVFHLPTPKALAIGAIKRLMAPPPGTEPPAGGQAPVEVSATGLSWTGTTSPAVSPAPGAAAPAPSPQPESRPMPRPRDRVLANLDDMYREAFEAAKASGDDQQMRTLDFAYRREQLYFEILLDIRDGMRRGD
jgi:hypothetical protein